jgi:hypothetical protein
MLKRLPSIALASILFSGLAGAQAELKWSDGVLGSGVTYDLTGPAGQLYYLLPSFSSGPTPLAFFDPVDPRLLNVGIDLLSFAQLGFLIPTASISLPLPAFPSFIGLPLRAQFVTIDPTFSSPTLVDQISNAAAFIMGGSGDVVGTMGDVTTPRQGHSATGLLDGRVLVIGGDEADIAGTLTSTATYEFYDPQTQTFAAAGNMTQARSTHTATRLNDGRVLIVGGYPTFGPGVASATAEIFDPVTGLTAATGAPSIGRTLHTATLLADGRVLVVGGGEKFDLSDIFGSLATVVNKTELFDPNTGTWTPGPNLPTPRFAHQASLLGDGKVLITSGVEVGSLFGIPIPSFTSSCLRYDPVTGNFVSTSSMPSARAYHGQIELPSGGAMVMGGATGDFTSLSFSTHTNVYNYNQNTNSWTSTGNLNVARAYPNLVDTGSGITVIAGLTSIDVTTGSGTPSISVESSDYSGISWTVTGTQSLPRETPRAVSIDGGKRILIVGTGDNGMSAVDKTAEVYIP